MGTELRTLPSITSTTPVQIMNMCVAISPRWKISEPLANVTLCMREHSSVTNTWSSTLPSPLTSKSGTCDVAVERRGNVVRRIRRPMSSCVWTVQVCTKGWVTG